MGFVVRSNVVAAEAILKASIERFEAIQRIQEL
jgi:hypothetical protein